MTEQEYYAQWQGALDDETSKALRRQLGQMWRTPRKLFDSLNAELGPFDLDAYADPYNALCEKYNTAEEPDKHTWAGHRVFANPPFGMGGKCVERAYWEALDNNVFSVLIAPASVNSKWHATFASYAEIRQPIGRIGFDPPPGLVKGSPRGDTEILVFDPAKIGTRCGSKMEVYKCGPITGARI